MKHVSYLRKKEVCILQDPDTIYFNGDIHTLDAIDSVHEAVAIKGQTILAVGSDDSMLRLKTKETNLIDLKGKTVLPGFIDAHIHLFSLGFNLSYVNCHRNSIEEVVQAIQQRAKATKCEDEWIIGWGFDESIYKEGRKLSKWDLQDIKNPVYITRYCLHEAVINEVALSKLNITEDTFVHGGLIERTETGEATGLLVEKATHIVENVLPPHTYEQMREAIELANQYLLERGITSIHDAGLGFLMDPNQEFAVLKDMSDLGSIQVKMYVMVLAEYYQEIVNKYAHLETEQLKMGALKLFADGTLSGKTAALFEPYSDTNEKGMLHYTNEALQEKMKIAYDLKKQVAIHAIGDRAINQAVQLFETFQQAYPDRDHRPRIEHTTISNDNIRVRMEKLGAIPVMQPTLVYMAGDTYYLDKKRLDNVFAVKSFIDHGVSPVASSDSPVVDCSPFLGMYALMRRETKNGKKIGKNQIVDLKTAIAMYTKNAAYAAFEEETKGSIEVGKDADFVVLPASFIHFSAEEVKQTHVEMTIVNGNIVYQK